MLTPTPGPYFVREIDGGYTVEKEESGLRSVLCEIHSGKLCLEHGGSAKSNALMFGTAAQMLHTLKKLEVQFSMGCYLNDPEMQAVMLASTRDAIAKCEVTS